MTRPSKQFRQSDVTTWGLVALVCGGLAVFGANVSAVLPSSLLVGLHKSRLEGFSMIQLRQDVSELRGEAARLQRENEVLNARFALQEQVGSDVTRRVGALEVSVPYLIESIPANSGIDRSTFTASIGSPDGQAFDAEGGSVSVRQVPLPQALAPRDASQPLPAEIAVASTTAFNATGYGVAIGPGIQAESGAAQWRDLEIRLGSLVGGMTPLVGEGNAPDQKQIIVGPFELMSEARDLCQRLEQMAVACLPTAYSGAPLPR